MWTRQTLITRFVLKQLHKMFIGISCKLFKMSIYYIRLLQKGLYVCSISMCYYNTILLKIIYIVYKKYTIFTIISIC